MCMILCLSSHLILWRGFWHSCWMLAYSRDCSLWNVLTVVSFIKTFITHGDPNQLKFSCLRPEPECNLEELSSAQPLKIELLLWWFEMDTQPQLCAVAACRARLLQTDYHQQNTLVCVRILFACSDVFVVMVIHGR